MSFKSTKYTNLGTENEIKFSFYLLCEYYQDNELIQKINDVEIAISIRESIFGSTPFNPKEFNLTNNIKYIEYIYILLTTFNDIPESEIKNTIYSIRRICDAPFIKYIFNTIVQQLLENIDDNEKNEINRINNDIIKLINSDVYELIDKRINHPELLIRID